MIKKKYIYVTDSLRYYDIWQKAQTEAIDFLLNAFQFSSSAVLYFLSHAAKIHKIYIGTKMAYKLFTAKEYIYILLVSTQGKRCCVVVVQNQLLFLSHG